MSKVTNEDFVINWATATDIKEVARTTGLTVATCRSRAKYLRSKGIKLPILKKLCGQRLEQEDIKKLNSLIAKHDIGEVNRARG